MPLSRYLALYRAFTAPRSEPQRLQQDLLYFLDDRHLPVTVSYFDRWPQWLRRHPYWANLVFLAMLLWSPAANVLIDAGLARYLGLTLPLARRLTRHCFILVPGETSGTLAGGAGPRLGRLAARWCLGAAHCLLVASEAAWRRLRLAAGLQAKLLWVRPHRRRRESAAAEVPYGAAPSGGRWRSFRALLDLERTSPPAGWPDGAVD
jgi:hypothetical protein